jgi:hypothetical protein
MARRDSALSLRTFRTLGIVVALSLLLNAALLCFFGAPVVVQLIVAGACGWKACDVERALGGVLSFLGPTFGRMESTLTRNGTP